jgi:ribosomal protein S27AE
MLPTRKQYLLLLGRALRLRCPRCGEGMLFTNWYHMRQRCDWCGLIYEREPGFFLGSIYVNYGLTALLTTAAYVALFATDAASPDALLWGLAGFCIVFPAWFFRYARSLWMAFDQLWDPRTEDDK